MIASGLSVCRAVASVFVLAAALAVGPAPIRAQTPNYRSAPLYGSANLAAGFSNRTRAVQIVAGGSSLNTITGDDCVGYIATPQPDYRVTYTPGPPNILAVRAESDSDTGLLIRTPEGHWLCNDDADGTDPEIVVSSAPRGVYNIWVSTFERRSARATLILSESAMARPDAADLMNSLASPSNGVVTWVSSGSRQTHVAQVTAGGPARNPVSGPNCVGSLDPSRPHIRLNYSAENKRGIEISSTSDTDLVLVVRRPDGSWECNDDSDGTNPLIRLAGAASGMYAIWVATFGTEEADAVLTVGEIR